MSAGQPEQRSRLTRRQARALRGVVGLGIFMLADTLYLLSFRLADALELQLLAVTATSLPKLYQVLVLSHTGAGLILAVLALVFSGWHLTRVWIRRRNRQALVSGIAVVVLGLGLAISGLFILTEANSQSNAWAFWAHVVCAVLVPSLYLAHRRVSVWKPSPRIYRSVVRWVAGLALAMVALHLTADRGLQLTDEARQAFEQGANTGPGSRDRDLTAYADEAGFIPKAFVPPDSPFFPSAATTTTGGFLPSRIITRGDVSHPQQLQEDVAEHGFAVDEKIGAATCERCHPDVVAQWAGSAHRFASFNNPFYEATINNMREEVGKEKSKWCSGCHDPSLMLAGVMSEEIDRASAQAQAGLTCLACHAIDHIHGVTGNGNYNIADEQEDPYLFAESEDGAGAFLHDTALKAKPTVHKRQMLKPFFRTSEYCATCHKVSIDSPVNGYRWLRAQNEYDAWHDSGVSRNASRTFYLPPAKRLCQDCHMPLESAPLGDVSAKEGLVRSHRFLAANTALPYLRGDTETLKRIEAFLRTEKLRIDIFALRLGPRFEDVIAPLDGVQPVLPAAEALQVDIVVRNLGVGHTFPGGTNDSNEGWLEVSLLDESGIPLAVSGAVGEDGFVEGGARFYKSLIVDRNSEPIQRRNAQDIHTSVWVRAIGPGTADIGRFRFRMPASLAGRQVTLRARLLWRKFDRAYTEFAYRANPEGFIRFDDVPDLPITEIARDEVALMVGDGSSETADYTPVEADWVRFNDYGIGLLLQGETRPAGWAFRRVSEAAPGRVDGPRNQARVALDDGNLGMALDLLRRCEEIAPGDPQTAWVWAVALQKEGRYDESEAAYGRVLEAFPEDRAALRNLGQVHYLNGDYKAALAVLDRALEIDPEDRAVHYRRMLALRALGRRQEAVAAESAYLKYQVDESAKEVTRRYLLEHPEDEKNTQLIRTHRLVATSNG